MSNRKWGKIWATLVVVIILSGLFWGSYEINKSFCSAKNVEQKDVVAKTEKSTEKTEENIPSTVGYVVVFTLLFGSLVAIAIMICREKRGTDKKIIWKEVWKHPVFIAIVAIPILYAMLYLFWYSAWQTFWKPQILFWGINISIILFVYFKTRKTPIVPGIIGLLIFLGLIAVISPEISSYWEKRQEEKKREAAEKAGKNLSMNTILNKIGEEESPGEPGGRQFNDDGTVVTHKNSDGSIDSGALQINDKANADLIKKHPEIKYKESKEDNYKMACLIVERDGDYRAWNATKDRWAPKLIDMVSKTSEETFRLLEAPSNDSGKASEKVEIPKGVYISWGESTDSFVAWNQNGLVARYDPKNKVIENLPYPSTFVRFRSLNDKPAIVKLAFSKVPLVNM
jgi:hypothetical protein